MAVGLKFLAVLASADVVSALCLCCAPKGTEEAKERMKDRTLNEDYSDVTPERAIRNRYFEQREETNRALCPLCYIWDKGDKNKAIVRCELLVLAWTCVTLNFSGANGLLSGLCGGATPTGLRNPEAIGAAIRGLVVPPGMLPPGGFPEGLDAEAIKKMMEERAKKDGEDGKVLLKADGEGEDGDASSDKSDSEDDRIRSRVGLFKYATEEQLNLAVVQEEFPGYNNVQGTPGRNGIPEDELPCYNNFESCCPFCENYCHGWLRCVCPSLWYCVNWNVPQGIFTCLQQGAGYFAAWVILAQFTVDSYKTPLEDEQIDDVQ